MAEVSASEEWKTEAEAVWQFGLLAAPNLGEYGGGDGLKLSCPIIVMKLPSSRIPKHILNKLPEQINDCITKNNKIAKDKRVARLPEQHINANEFINEWSKTCHFLLQSHVPLASSNRYNIMYQGWLFKDIPNDPQRLGCSLFPLIGIYDTFGCIQFNEQNKLNKNDEILHYAGYNNLNWSDQHCHLDFGAWHFGSDMSKIIIELNSNLIKFWSVCVDCQNKKIDISLIYIIGHMYVSQIEGLIRNCNPNKSKSKCKQFYQLFCPLFNDEFLKMKIKNEKSILAKLLFGYDINKINKNENIQVEQKEQANEQKNDDECNDDKSTNKNIEVENENK
eukprot:181879_1